ncbi:MAG: hypothetical protein AMJ43_00680, partial [Coxiella sp. DG_40]
FKKKIIEEFKPELKITKAHTNDDSLSSKADFIFQNCKEYLVGVIENGNKLHKKIILILAFIFSFISVSLFKTINLFASKESNVISIIDYKIIMFFLLTIITYALIACILILIGFYPRDKAITGNEPKNLLIQSYIEQPISLIKIGESINYQNRIRRNLRCNKKVASLIKYSILGLILIPIVFSLIVFL